MTWTLLAQADSLSGGGGWVGAGLLGLVLSWLLLVHLPSKEKKDTEKDKLNREWLTEKDVLLKEIIDGKDKHIEAITAAFQETMNEVIKHCKEETAYWRDFKIPPPKGAA